MPEPFLSFEGHEVFHGKRVRVGSTVQLWSTRVYILASTRGVAVSPQTLRGFALDIELLLFDKGCSSEGVSLDFSQKAMTRSFVVHKLTRLEADFPTRMQGVFVGLLHILVLVRETV